MLFIKYTTRSEGIKFRKDKYPEIAQDVDFGAAAIGDIHGIGS